MVKWKDDSIEKYDKPTNQITKQKLETTAQGRELIERFEVGEHKSKQKSKDYLTPFWEL